MFSLKVINETENECSDDELYRNMEEIEKAFVGGKLFSNMDAISAAFKDDELFSDMAIIESAFAKDNQENTSSAQGNEEIYYESNENFYDDHDDGYGVDDASTDKPLNLEENQASDQNENLFTLLPADKIKKYVGKLVKLVSSSKNWSQAQLALKLTAYLNDVYKLKNHSAFFMSVKFILHLRKRKFTDVLLQPSNVNQEKFIDNFLDLCVEDEHVNNKLVSIAGRAIFISRNVQVIESFIYHVDDKPDLLQHFIDAAGAVKVAAYAFSSRISPAIDEIMRRGLHQIYLEKSENLQKDIESVFASGNSNAIVFLKTFMIGEQNCIQFYIAKFGGLLKILASRIPELIDVIIDQGNLLAYLEISLKNGVISISVKHVLATRYDRAIALLLAVRGRNLKCFLDIHLDEMGDQAVPDVLASQDNEAITYMVDKGCLEHYIKNAKDITVALEHVLSSRCPYACEKASMLKDRKNKSYFEGLKYSKNLVESFLSSRSPVVIKLLIVLRKSRKNFLQLYLEEAERMGVIRSAVALVLAAPCPEVIEQLAVLENANGKNYLQAYLEEAEDLEKAINDVLTSRCVEVIQKLVEWIVPAQDVDGYVEECYLDVFIKTPAGKNIYAIFDLQAKLVLAYLLAKHPQFVIDQIKKLTYQEQEKCFNTVMKSTNTGMKLIADIFYVFFSEPELFELLKISYNSIRALNNQPARTQYLQRIHNAIKAMMQGDRHKYESLRQEWSSGQKEKTEKFILKSKSEEVDLSAHLEEAEEAGDITVAIQAFFSARLSKFIKPLVVLKNKDGNSYLQAHFEKTEKSEGIKFVNISTFRGRCADANKQLTILISQNGKNYLQAGLEEAEETGDIDSFVKSALSTHCTEIVDQLVVLENKDGKIYLQADLEKSEDVEEAVLSVFTSRNPTAMKKLIEWKVPLKNKDDVVYSTKCFIDVFVEIQENKNSARGAVSQGKGNEKNSIYTIFQIQTTVVLEYLIDAHTQFVVDQLNDLEEKDKEKCFDAVLKPSTNINVIVDIFYIFFSEKSLFSLFEKSYDQSRKSSNNVRTEEMQRAKEAINGMRNGNLSLYHKFRKIRQEKLLNTSSCDTSVKTKVDASKTSKAPEHKREKSNPASSFQGSSAQAVAQPSSSSKLSLTDKQSALFSAPPRVQASSVSQSARINKRPAVPVCDGSDEEDIFPPPKKGSSDNVTRYEGSTFSALNKAHGVSGLLANRIEKKWK